MEISEYPAATLSELYWAGVRAAAPGPALSAALEKVAPRAPAGKVWIVALGKAAHPMASAAVTYLTQAGRTTAGGVIIAPEPAGAPKGLSAVVGDHPVAGPRSLAAAEAMGRLTERARAGDEAWVLLSGGATSLVAAPVAGLDAEALQRLYRALLYSGLDISSMNAVRKRFSRWGAGRLAVALYPARVRTFVVSDVIGDDISAIGSGPCVADQTRAAGVRRILDQAGLWSELPPAIDQYLRRAEQDPKLETPKSAHPALQAAEWHMVASNRLSLLAVARRAAERGFRPKPVTGPVKGDAAEAGRILARRLLDQPSGSCLVAGGETVVRIPSGSSGIGGRCQELALAAAREMSRVSGASLLAAGTDGRDGPNDAAGAIVDGSTWQAIAAAGRDPEAELAAHNSHPALDSVGALLRTGLTGTNVMDLMIGLRSHGPRRLP